MFVEIIKKKEKKKKKINNIRLYYFDLDSISYMTSHF